MRMASATGIDKIMNRNTYSVLTMFKSIPKILILSTLCLIAVFSYNSIAWATNYCNDASIIGCYPAQEDAGITLVDHSSNANNGTFGSSGHPVWTTAAPARSYLTYCLAYSTSSDSISLGSSFITGTAVPQSFVTWIFPTATSSTRIIDRGPGDTILQMATTNAINFSIAYSTTSLSVTTSNNTMTLNTWNDVIVTWDGSTTATNVHIYINGAEATYQTQTNGVGTITSVSGQTLYLGNRADGTRNVNGNLTEIAFFSRVLSSSDVSSIYNNGLLQIIPTANLVAGGTVNMGGTVKF